MNLKNRIIAIKSSYYDGLYIHELVHSKGGKLPPVATFLDATTEIYIINVPNPHGERTSGNIYIRVLLGLLPERRQGILDEIFDFYRK